MKTDRLTATLLFFSLGAIILAGCQAARVEVAPSGNYITESRNVSGFHAVNAGGNAHVEIDRTGTESFEITIDDNLLPHMQIEVKNGTLYVQPKPNVLLMNDQGYTVTLTAKAMDELTLQGNSNAQVTGIDTPQWRANLNGNNFVKLEGSAVRQDVVSVGNAFYDAQDLASEQAAVRAEGNSNIIVRVSDKLDATVSGLSRVEYIGAPSVRKNVQGLASVEQRAVH